MICSLFRLLELDECASHPCANNGTCTDLENGFLCHCLPEWNGTLCTEAKSKI
jgi:cubilin